MALECSPFFSAAVMAFPLTWSLCFCLYSGSVAVAHIINEAELRAVICTGDKVDKVRFELFPSNPPVLLLICSDSVPFSSYASCFSC